MSLEEINDFYVQRKQMIVSETKETIHVICAHIEDNQIDKKKRDLMSSQKDCRTTSNISQIRIQAAVFVAEEVSPCEYSRLIENYSKQVGAHLMVDSKGCLCYVYTNLDQNHNYLSSPLRYISDIYPSFVSSDTDSKMCLGLRFTKHLDLGSRSFGRTKDDQNPSGGVFDLTEALIHPQYLKKGLQSKVYQTLFPSEDYHYFIYVCVGAKLIVEDDRFFEFTDKAEENLGKNINCSLFQSGSMVVFTGGLVFQTSYSLTTDENGERYEAIRHMSFDESIKRKLIRPEDGLYKHWFRQRQLHRRKARVIFLGYNPSVHNSICWRLRINYLDHKYKHSSAVMSAPEGGRIVDIQSWSWGMAEIYWRHCFERLYDKVLSPSMTRVYDQRHYFNYYNPDFRGKNTFYWQRKIVGVGLNFNSWKFCLKYNYKQQTHGLIPPYYEQHTDVIETVPPFAPPLHPPIYCERQFYYLPYKTCPQYLCNQFVKINGQLFKIKYKEGVEEYNWTDAKRVSLYQNNKFSTDERLGIDFLVYKREESVIGTKILFYFLLYSKQTDHLSAEFTREWIRKQNNESKNFVVTKTSDKKESHAKRYQSMINKYQKK